MRPIHSRHFGHGTDKLSVLFYNGTAVVTGHIVKQMGARTYMVSDGTTTKPVKLATDTADAAVLAGNASGDLTALSGLATIAISYQGQTAYVRTLWPNTLLTTDGARISWTHDGMAAARPTDVTIGAQACARHASNLLAAGDDLLAPVWTKNKVTIVAMDGEQAIMEVESDANDTGKGVSQRVDGLATIASSYVLTGEFKPNGRDFILFHIGAADYSDPVMVLFNVTTGKVVYSKSSNPDVLKLADCHIRLQESGWYRCVVAFDKAADVPAIMVQIKLQAEAAHIAHAGEADKGVFSRTRLSLHHR